MIMKCWVCILTWFMACLTTGPAVYPVYHRLPTSQSSSGCVWQPALQTRTEYRFASVPDWYKVEVVNMITKAGGTWAEEVRCACRWPRALGGTVMGGITGGGTWQHGRHLAAHGIAPIPQCKLALSSQSLGCSMPCAAQTSAAPRATRCMAARR